MNEPAELDVLLGIMESDGVSKAFMEITRAVLRVSDKYRLTPTEELLAISRVYHAAKREHLEKCDPEA